MGADRQRVEAAMLDAVRTPDAYLTEIASHLITAGGKRLRPVMTIVASQIGTNPQAGPATHEAVQGGIACELVHLGSLYHDDVMDEAETRRGVETVNAKWGNLQAILAGDFLLARASEIAASLGTEVAGLLARTIGQLCEGQIEELRHTHDIKRPVDSYLLSIEGKTASLYSTSARIGGLLAGLSPSEVEALTNYGTAFGMVFQIVDDLLDIIATDEELGKPLSSYERDKALSIVRSGPGVASAIDSAQSYVQLCDQYCNKLPQSAATDALRAAPSVLLNSVIR